MKFSCNSSNELRKFISKVCDQVKVATLFNVFLLQTKYYGKSLMMDTAPACKPFYPPSCVSQYTNMCTYSIHMG